MVLHFQKFSALGWYHANSRIGIWQFFRSWYQAVNVAIPQASEFIDAMIPVVDPVKKTHVVLDDALTALTIGFLLIPALGPEFAALSKLAISAANLALNAIKAFPGVARAIWPKGTENSQPQQIADLKGQIAYLQSSLQQYLGLGLSLVQGTHQSNVSAFLAFADNGAFSVPPSLLPINNTVSPLGGLATAINQPLLLALTTYLVSTALAQNGWHIIQVPGQSQSLKFRLA